MKPTFKKKDIDLILIRHAPTAWNLEKRFQGHTDIPITEESKKWLTSWQKEKLLSYFSSPPKIFISPLQRARFTAEALFNQKVHIEHRLIEMNFGDWEGKTLLELKQEFGDEIQKNEDKGLDFTPAQGESPRHVLQRITPFFKEIYDQQINVICISHLAVIRAVMAQATDWPMLGKPPYKLNHAEAHHFKIDAHGQPRIITMNIKLTNLMNPHISPSHHNLLNQK